MAPGADQRGLRSTAVAQAWTETVFGPDHALTWGQECARAALVFAYGLLLLRLGGRRVFGRWSALDIVVSIIVGSSLSRTLTGAAPLFGTLAATTLMVGLHAALAQTRLVLLEPAGTISVRKT